MKALSAHVTGFYRSSFHAYTTEVTVDGHRWRLGLRYSKFHEFYDRLMVQEKDFRADFPPKGTLFFTPKPEERQEQLEAFLQQVLAYYGTKKHPMEVENLLCDLLKVPRHLRSSEREDDDVSTSTESVVDEPMHEPTTIEKEEEKTQVAKSKAVFQQEVVTDVVAMKETETVAPETAPPVSPEADEAHAEELKEEARIALHPAEAAVVTPAVVEESEVSEETVKENENIASVDKEVIHEEETDPTLPLVPAESVAAETLPAEELAAETEEAAKKDTVFETHLEDPKVSSLDESEVMSLVEQSVIKPIAHEYTQAEEKRAVSEGTSVEEDMKQKELAASEQTSSWIAAYLPKSLVVFFQRRCMKKTNLVVLCVALLLPMVLARR